jgi:intraflagellar transport protein 172
MKRYEEAEKSYIEVEEVDAAINMYKQARRFDDMIRLVKKYRKEYLFDTHVHLGKQLAQEGNTSEAEKHFVAAQPAGWERAVDMYRTSNRWEDALRVAKVHGGKEASSRVAYIWAQSLGGESGRKLLKKLGLAKGAVDYAIQEGEYENAIELAEHAAPEKMADVLCACALAKVREGDFRGAEKLFVDAGKPEEGVRMYTNVRDWTAARQMAENYCPVVVSEVHVAQGKHEFEQVYAKKNISSGEKQAHLNKAEQLFLLGHKPEECLKMYITEHLWQDARRICKRHCPDKLDKVTEAYQKFLVSGKKKKKKPAPSAATNPPRESQMTYSSNEATPADQKRSPTGRVSNAAADTRQQQQQQSLEDSAGDDTEDVIAAGKMWEESGQWSNAVDAYVSVPPASGGATHTKYDVSRVWKRAVEICAQYVPQRYREVATKVAVNLRDSEEQYMDAAKLFLEVEKPYEALMCLMKGAFWDEARKLCRQRLPDDVGKVETAYHQYLIDQGDASSLLQSRDVDAKASGLDILAANKQWEQLLPAAKAEGVAVAGKYAVLCAQDKMASGDFDAAVRVLAEWGAPPSPAHFQLYKDISWGVLGRSLDAELEVGAAEHATSAKAVKKYMYNVVKRLRTSARQAAPEEEVQELETLLMAAHYYSLSAAIITGNDLVEAATTQFQAPVSPQHKGPNRSSALTDDDPLMDLSVKMTIAQLRYVRVGGAPNGGVPADKAFFQAGILCKRQNQLRSAFVFLNRYLDIADAIDDGDRSGIDHKDFKHTDIPGPEHMELPATHYLSEALRDEVRDWVLAVSMDQKVVESLPTEKCESCNSQLAEGCLSCPSCHVARDACIVTGWPVPPYDTIERSGCKACRKDWNTYISANKLCPWSGKPERVA